MANTDHKVLVTFEADTKKLRDAMKNVTGDSKKFQSQNKKHTAEDTKNTKKINDLNDKRVRSSKINVSRESRENKQKNKDLKDQLTWYQKIGKAVKQLYSDQRGSVQPPGTGGKPPKKPPSRMGAGGSFLRGAVGSAGLNLAGYGVSALSSLVAMPFGAVGEQYDAARAYRMQLSGLSGYAGGGVKKSNVDEFRKKYGQPLGYTAQETIGATRATARATGSFEGTGSAMSLGRLLGEDPTAIAGMFGTLRQAGTKGFSEKGAGYKAITQAIAAGMTTGLEKARMPEFLDGVMSLTQRAASREAHDVSSTPFARLLATLGRSGASGLQGARGARVASALEEGFTSPGGGEEGMAIGLSAMGFGRGGPGGNKSYYEARKGLQMGTSGDPNFVKNMIDRVNQVYGGGEESNLALEQMLGGSLSLSQIEEVQKAMAEGGSPEELAKMLKAATESERDILQDIRNLLSGNNDELLDATRRSIAIENENVDAGTELTASMERIQDIFREFIKDTLEGVKTAMELVAGFLEDMKPILKDISSAINELVNFLANKESNSARTLENKQKQADRARVETARILAAPEAQLTSSADIAAAAVAASELYEASEAQREATRNMSFFEQGMRGLEDATLQNAAGRSPTEEMMYQTQADARTAMRSFDTIARRLGFTEAEGQTDTPAEIRAMLTFLVNNNVSLPESIRAQITNTGGAQ